MATLGDKNRWPEIMKANPGLNERRLKISQVLNIPRGGGTSVADAPKGPGGPKVNTFEPMNKDDGPSGDPAKREEAPKAKPETPKVPAADASTREVEVRSGDTLYEISRRELGDANLYYKILKANPGLDPKKLKVGMKVRVPSDK